MADMGEPGPGDRIELEAPRSLTREKMEAAALEGRQVGGKLDDESAASLLGDGAMEVVGRLLEASNATFFCVVEDRSTGRVASCVYKPIRGERPLYDFPDGTLACREVAAFAISEAGGWRVVPPTVMRDGPFGPGMAQLWVEVDQSADLAALVNRDIPALRRIALFDAVLNNADRKGGHLLPLPDGRILAIDNGLSFSVEPKLRTVLWQWRGKPLEPEELATLERLREAIGGELAPQLRELLTPAEVRAMERRIDHLLAGKRMPLPDRNRPVVPWPPF